MKYAYLKSFTVVLLLLSGQRAVCCINRYSIHSDGNYSYDDDNVGVGVPRGNWRYNVDKQRLALMLHDADSTCKATSKIEDYSDYGAMLIYNKQYLKARDVFLDIETKKPGLYATAANIGTTYELLGKDDSALYWIRKAVSNPYSHHGSEWIHVKILEAKINAKGDNKYYKQHSVLSLDFGSSDLPKYNNTTNIALDSLVKQLYYQLDERITFIKPKDPIVAQLLFDLGNADAYNVGSALAIYKTAIKYGYYSELLDRRIVYFENLAKKEDRKNAIDEFEHDHMGVILITLALLAISLVFFIPLAITKYITRGKDKPTLSSSAHNKDGRD